MTEEKRLYRSRRDRVISGVCGGLGEYFKVDPSLIRLAWALLATFGGSGLILYIFAWFILPENPKQKKGGKTTLQKEVEYLGKRFGARGEVFFGLMLVGLGVVFLWNNFVPWFNLWKLWPGVLIIIGAWIIFSKSSEK